METSQQPLAQTLRKILKEQGVSQHELARRTRRHGWGSVPAVNMLGRGYTPSVEAIEAVSFALEIPPETFQEYELLKLRDSLDPNKVGMAKAMLNFRALDGR